MSAFDPLPVFCDRCRAILKSKTPAGGDLMALSECPACGRQYGVHASTWLPTDEDTVRLFDEAIARLHQDTDEYSFQEASALAQRYYRQFTDPAFCTQLGIPTQDDELFHHEGAAGLALRIHYYLTLRGDPTPKAFVAWRAANQ